MINIQTLYIKEGIYHMQRILSVFLIFALCMGLTVMTGCSKDEQLANGYEGLDFTSYITLPDYNAYSLDAPSAEPVADVDVDAEIESFLSEFAETKEVKEGDRIKYFFLFFFF